MDKKFQEDCHKLFADMRYMGGRARKIIKEFVEKQGGDYTIDYEDNDERIWVGEDVYATRLSADVKGDIVVSNSCDYGEYLSCMGDDNILDLAIYLNNMMEENK